MSNTHTAPRPAVARRTEPPSPSSWNEKYNQVRIGVQVLSRTLAESDNSQWQLALQRAYISKAPPECLCESAAPVPMYIARLGDTYVLKRRPKTGHMHHAECESHGGISKAANDLYNEEAIHERADGRVNHSLSVPMSTIETVGDVVLDEVAAPPRPTTATPKCPSMTLRGFLNLLWEESGLATWAPGMMGKRTVTRVYWRLNNELADRLIAGDDAQLRVFIPSGHLNEATERATRQDIENRFDTLNRLYPDNKRAILLVIGELRTITSTSRNVAMRIKGLPDSMPIWTPPNSIERLRTQWPSTMDRFDRSKVRDPQADAQPSGTRPNRLIVIAGIQRSVNGNLLWRYGAAMETTEDFIPIDSQYEARIANALAAQGRSFKKPVRYDGIAATFPDFVLTDTPSEIPLEIYGFNSPDYQKRKLEKIAHYAATKKPYWHWDVSENKNPPPFPAATNNKK